MSFFAIRKFDFDDLLFIKKAPIRNIKITEVKAILWLLVNSDKAPNITGSIKFAILVRIEKIPKLNPEFSAGKE